MNGVRILATAALAAVGLSSIAVAQPAGTQGGRGGPTVVSPEVSADRRVTFRVLAPNAQKVTFLDDDFGPMLSAGGPGPLAGSTEPAVPAGFRVPEGGLTFTKHQDGVWEATFGPLPPGAYRYAF
jgi:enterochelin esterase family protein